MFTGGPNSVYADNAPQVGKELFELGIPVLGICYGAQIMAHALGGEVSHAPSKEYGKTETKFELSSPMFEGLDANMAVSYTHLIL